MVNNVGIDDTVEDVATNETEIAIDSCESSRDEGPPLTIVMRKILVGMVKVRNGNCCSVNQQNHPTPKSSTYPTSG